MDKTIFGLTEDWVGMLTLLEDAAHATAEETEGAGAAMDAVEEQWAALMDATEDKVERCASAMKYLEAAEKAAKVEADRIRNRARMFAGNRNDLKQRLIMLMETAGAKKIKGTRYTVSVTAPRKSVEVTNASSLPDTYLIPQEPRVDKTAIGRALKAGQEIEGAALVEGEPGLMIR